MQDPRSKKLIGTDRREKSIYVLEELHLPAIAASSVDLFSFHLNLKSSNFHLWHSCLGHISYSHL